MSARPLQCKFCRGIFLPVSEQAWSAVQCPHCSGQMKVGECEPADLQPPPGGQEYHRVTEEDEGLTRSERAHNWWTGRLVILACAVPLLGLLAFIVSRQTGDPKQKPKEIVRTHSEGSDAERREVQMLAQEFLGADDWPGALPHAAGAQRVRGAMEWYYATHPWQRVAGEVRIAGIQRMNADGREMLRVQATTDERAAIWLLLVKEAGVWKVDWEIFANAAVVRWQSFVSEPPGAVVELPLLAARKPAPETYMVKAGVAPESHDAVVLWARDRQSRAAAVLPKDSLLWKDLAGMDFEKPVAVIARVTMVAPDFEPPLVKLEAIVQKGWLRAVQLPVAGDAPKQ